MLQALYEKNQYFALPNNLFGINTYGKWIIHLR